MAITRKNIIIGILFVGIAQSFAWAKNDTPSKLPIRKVILYKHGVGYFERLGQLPGQTDTVLHFKKEQMNDLLKSMTILDLQGGQVNRVVYDSTKTSEQLLNQFNFNLKGPMSLSLLLSQLQGTEIQCTLIGSDQVEGTIVGVRTRTIERENHSWPASFLTLLDSKGLIRTLEFDNILTVQFKDDQLDKDVKQYLKILHQQHRRDEKQVAIHPNEPGLRDILVGYVTETPVWKTSYRVVLPDENKKPFLQGWAIVDNVSEENWDNVELLLVSGLPISFIQNLYDPIYKKRKRIEIEEEMAMAPSVPESGMEFLNAGGGGASTNNLSSMMAKARSMQANEEDGDHIGTDEAVYGWYFDSSQQMRNIQSQSVTRDIGDLFEYKIDQPVSVDKNKSAMIAIVAKEIDGKAVSLYNESVRTKNPLSAFRMKNSTDLTLEGGPMTLFQDGSYVGEAIMNTMKADEENYITYAVDLGCDINSKYDSKTEPVSHVIINRGFIQMKHYVIETKTYHINNKSDKDKIVIIEHPIKSNWELISKQQPIEITDSFKRFEVKAAPNKTTSFTVKERYVDGMSTSVSNIKRDRLELYIRNKYLSPNTQKVLLQFVELREAKSKITDEIHALRAEKKSIFDAQSHIRKNLSALGRTDEEKQLRSRYIKKLNSQEDRTEAINKLVEKLRDQDQDLLDQINALLTNLQQDIKI